MMMLEANRITAQQLRGRRERRKEELLLRPAHVKYRWPNEAPFFGLASSLLGVGNNGCGNDLFPYQLNIVN
jgi:hypothetical protein